MRTEDEREYTEYVAARLGRLHRAAYLLCGDPHRADDVVQSALTSLYVHWRKARAAEHIDAYVHRILVRRYLDEKRRAWSRVELRATSPERAAPDGYDLAERDAVLRALRELPVGQRTVLVLRYFCDLSVEEAARAMGCSQGNVKSQSSRGLATLRERLGGAVVAVREEGRS
jgi:RNA polymerase sigma-70 factor (sigma-E family)